jgi:DNA polymerase-1
MTPKSSDSSPKRKKLAIIDGKSVFYRGYYAMPNLSTKDGTPTGGVFGFASMALEVIKRLKPDYVAVAWDKPKTNIRRRLQLYPEYKAGRKPAPADFKAQIPVLHELLQAFGWPLYEMDDYEADDIMGTLAVQATAKDIETMLITSDLDMLQLVNEHVHVFALKKGLSNIELYSPESFTAKYGIRVNQFLDLKSLKGDSSDNIPGVPGIGEKGAVALLQQFETLDGVYDNLGLIKDATRRKLEAGKDLAYLSHELADIWTDAPISLDLDEVDGTKCDPEEILNLLQKLEFRSLVRALPEVMHIKGNITAKNAFQQGKLADNVVIASAGDLADLELPPSENLLIHARAAGRHGKDPRILLLSPLTAGEPGKVYSFDLAKLPHEAVATKLNDYLGASGAYLVGYDVKTSMKVLMELGVGRPAVGHDVLIGAFLLNSLRREQTLTELAEADLNYAGSSLEELSDEEIIQRAPDFVSLICALREHQVASLHDIPKLEKLAHDIEWPVITVLADMEYEGMLLNTKYLQDFAVEIDSLIAGYEQSIYEHAGQEFNIGSPSQLADILFETIGLDARGIKKGKTGYSTAASELDKLRGQHPVIDLITQYREVAKLKNTYVDTLPKMVDDDSRVHTTFALTVAQTGRLSSNDPNLQNIPTRTDLGRRIRTAFVAGKGNKLVSADYSQFELRLAAVMAEDTELVGMFNSGADIHTATAAMVYGRKPEDVTKTMRSAAKTINFGILYGMSPHGLSIATGMDRVQAVTFIEKYKAVRRPLFDYMDKTRERAREQGYVETLHGRRRPMPDIHSSNFIVRQAAERAAINMPIQGTEADLMKLAMIKVDQLLHADFPESKQLLQVHDSILVECPEDDATAIASLLKDAMENIYKLPVRLDVDVSIGDNWGEL